MPLAKPTVAVLKNWQHELQSRNVDVLFPSITGRRLSVHGVQYLLNKHRKTAARSCPSLGEKRVTVHRLRHTMAMDLLQEGVDRATIALWLGHESVETTQVYLDATIVMRQKILDRITPHGGKPGRFRPADRLLTFLNSL